jgi:uncharacterized protein (DUF1810 family)
MADVHNLERFILAQQQVYPAVLAELKAGQKQTHWMWFVFPQIKGLGRSATAQHYAIASKEEARAYLEHPVLGRRLQECARIISQIEGRSAEQVFGGIDALKLRSCMTLFALTSEEPTIFNDILNKFFDGKPDQATIGLLSSL